MSLFGDSTNLGLSFIVRNTAPQGKQLKVFNTPVANGNTIDVMKIPGISEDDVKASVLKGDLGKKLQIKYLTLVSTTLNFGSGNSDPAYAGLLTNLGITTTPSQNNQTIWYVSPATGNDANTGLSGSPLKTLKELGRRLSSSLTRSLITVNILDNITDSTDNLQIFGAPQSQGTSQLNTASGWPNVAIRIIGQRTTSSFVDPNTSSTTALTMTSDCLPPSTATGTAGFGGLTSGLPVTLTVSGFDFTPYIGQMIEVLSSPTSGATGAIGTICSAPSLGTAYLQPLMQLQSTTGQNFSANALTTAKYPASTSTFRIYTTTSWAPHFSVGMMESTDAIAFRDITFPSVAFVQYTRGQNMLFEGCTWNRVYRQSSGGEDSKMWVMLGCCTMFPTPSGGRTPTQIPNSGTEIRHGGCAFINASYRIREGNGRASFSNCLFMGSDLTCAGPNDNVRNGGIFSLLLAPIGVGGAITDGNFGTGFFNWFSPDTLAPSPSTTRGSIGAAVTVGHNARVNFGTIIYGYSSSSGTVGVKILEGASLMIADFLTNQTSPVNLGGANPNYIPASLRISGLAGEINLDGYASHVPYSVMHDFITGAIPAQASNLVTLATWADWETGAFLRRAKSELTGASIISIYT